MAETTNIARMAEILSGDLFNSFGWTKVGPTNVNWDCVKEDHDKLTHPSDIVWSYNEPYADRVSYINADLKSYAKGSIKTDNIASAIRSLALAIDCAEASQAWQDLYVATPKPWDVTGLLFIYNHDGDYDSDFQGLLNRLKFSELSIPTKRKIVVLSPKDICELQTIHIDICKQSRIAPHLMPAPELCSFFYPDLRRKKLHHSASWKFGATLDLLTSPIVPLKAKSNAEVQDYDLLHIYYRGAGTTREEFLYLIDYLFAFQQTRNASMIKINMVSPLSPNAAVNFSNAQDLYADQFNPGTDLNKITCGTVTEVVTRFSEIELGL